MVRLELGLGNSEVTFLILRFIEVPMVIMHLKGKYHENLLSFQNPKMFDCQQKQQSNCQVC